VDQQLKQLMKNSVRAINESLLDSESIAEVVFRIKEGGYDISSSSGSHHRRQQAGGNTTDKNFSGLEP